MKAFILAAGMGTRLRSLDLDLPKVMVPVGDKPLLQHHIELFRGQGVYELLINLHDRPEKITEYFEDGSRFGVNITYSYEYELRGTAGAVKKMEEMLRDGPFIVFYGDNLVNIQFAPLFAFHQAKGGWVTVALFTSLEPWTGGVVETDADGRILRFIEKPDPDQVSTDLISAGIFVVEPQIFSMIPENTFYDFGKDLFPTLLKQEKPLYAMKPGAYIQDIGTPERLEKARRDYIEGLVRS